MCINIQVTKFLIHLQFMTLAMLALAATSSALPQRRFRSAPRYAAPAAPGRSFSHAAAASNVQESFRSSGAAPEQPVAAIVRSSFDGPTAENPGFRSYFESDDGQKQEMIGEMRQVGDANVVVMRGSYEYVDANGDIVTVNWYADETGYHPDNLPEPVEIPFPEQKAAVEAQIRFAQQEQSSSNNNAEVIEARSFNNQPYNPQIDYGNNRNF